MGKVIKAKTASQEIAIENTAGRRVSIWLEEDRAILKVAYRTLVKIRIKGYQGQQIAFWQTYNIGLDYESMRKLWQLPTS